MIAPFRYLLDEFEVGNSVGVIVLGRGISWKLKHPTLHHLPAPMPIATKAAATSTLNITISIQGRHGLASMA